MADTKVTVAADLYFLDPDSEHGLHVKIPSKVKLHLNRKKYPEVIEWNGHVFCLDVSYADGMLIYMETRPFIVQTR